ncbi:MAG: hydroxymethylbilane synthase [Proteobacteria bacterium]|nr:hydroxymethylbilane synthase [Pseudomonadota bacterium]
MLRDTKIIRIATRSSALAMWQAEHVSAQLRHAHAGLVVKLIPITTTGDKILDRPLAKIGGKGLFIKELEQALFDDHADIAVHSMKDVPVATPSGLAIPVILEREDPRDALVTRTGNGFEQLPKGATVGTSSLRRRSQLLAQRDDLDIRDLRGNVTTRVDKLERSEFDAIVLASAGLIRLGLSAKIAQRFTVTELVPAVGQGAIGIECRADDVDTQALIQVLHHPDSGIRVAAERAMSAFLDGGCDIPLAAHATLHEGVMTLVGLVASVDGRRIAREEITGPMDTGSDLGRALGASLVAAGAREILGELRGA